MPQEPIATWVCMLCGYAHYGPEPPDPCPVCGASREAFERQDAEPAPKPSAPTAWRCVICGYVHAGVAPPAECPVCGATADEFEPHETPAQTIHAASLSRPLRLVIVGAGIAGLSAAEAARDTSPDAEIVLIGDETAPPYYRLNLSRYLADEIEPAVLPMRPPAWYAEKRIRIVSGRKVRAIDLEAQAVALDDGDREPYDRLVLACGAHPFIPPIPGATLEGATAFRTIEDAERLLRHATPGAPIACVGGGILGLETAGGLAKRGADVTVLEGFDWLLPRQLDPDSAAMLERHAAGLGIKVRFRAKPAAIDGDRRVRCVRLEDGAEIPAALAVIATGVRANTHLARSAKIAVNQGIVVDDGMAASAPGIYAAGDVAEHQGTLYGLWEPARLQGVVAGINAAGGQATFASVPRANTLKVLGLGLFSVGVAMPEDGSYDVVCGRGEGTSARYVFREGRLAGAVLVGDTTLAAKAAAAVRDRREAAALLLRQPTADAIGRWLRDE